MHKTLQLTAKIWFILATIGQWIFGLYITLFYGKATIKGDFETWNKVLPHGYRAGDTPGNLVVGIHLLFAIIMVVGGPLQFIPQIRNRFAGFHRLLGKVYVFTAILMAIDGLVMVITRSTVGGTIQHVSISIQAIYIIAFAILTIYFAQKRKINIHNQWALRLFMVANGVWFFRVGLMFWLLIHQKPVGFDPDTFDGPFLWFLAIFIYALPLPILILELYLRATKSTNKIFIITTTVVLAVFTAIMAIGIVGASMGLWLPRISF